MFRLRFAQLVEAGEISEADAQTFAKWVNLTNTPTFNIYIMGRTGMLDHLKGDEGYNATMRVLEVMGLEGVVFNNKSAQPLEEQFWEQFDGAFDLSEQEMRRELPNFVTDPSNQAKVQALLAGDGTAAIDGEQTQRLA